MGAWLPEPMVVFSGVRDDVASVACRERGDPLQQMLLRDSISVAYLIMLEELSPAERAIFLLREIFAYDFDDIAEMVNKKLDNCRQILSRAKKKLDSYNKSSLYSSLSMQDHNTDGSKGYNSSVNQAILA